MAKVKIALIQAPAKKQLNRNLQTAVREISAAAAKGAKIVCLQELFRSPYFCQTEDYRAFQLAETLPGPTTDILSELAARRKIVIIAPVFEKRAKGVFHNSAAVIDADGSLSGVYRKMHIPQDPGFYEKFYFSLGDQGFPCFQTRYARIGVLICWDQWFPEAARIAALNGAEILFYPTAIGWNAKEPPRERSRQQNAWQTVQRSHALANQVYVAACNRVGRENKLTFWGASFVADPFGNVIARAGGKTKKTLIAACDLGLIEKARQEWPFWRDRRIDAYDPVRKRSSGPELKEKKKNPRVAASGKLLF